VIDLRVGIHPYHSRSAARRLLHRSHLRPRCLGRSRCRSGHRGWGWSSCLGCHGSRRRGCCRSGRRRRKPRLDSLMSTAGSSLAWSRRIRSVLTLPGRPCGGLRQSNIHGKQACRNRQ
jgi:hypothetical protein